MEYATIKKTNRVNTENREEEGENRSPEFQVTETTDEYSLASHPQNTVEEDTLDYSEVQFSKPTTILHHSAPRGHLADSVLYAEPWTDGNPASQSKEESPSLYSTIALRQQ
ncbi:uncharacterized protein LOC110367897 [Fundulus heteroclitus]|uniref:uncharacterized protein LOC110367897 n=1 Tax=Fundulus heteroclitus TaxID=8078 RepID=UPI00165C4AE6|nr:uncharacterized protein LOC110367897 [Fundulus heteroclitus]